MPVNRRIALRGGALAAASTVLLTRPAFAAPAAKLAVSPVPAATASIVAAYRQLQTGINRPQPPAVAADQLTAGQLARYLKPVKRFVGNPNLRANNASIVETGANRADKALISIVSGAMLGDAAWIKTGIDALTDVAGGGA